MITKLIGLCFLIGSLAVVYLFESSSHFTGALRIFHWPAMVLTLVGPCALVMTCSDWKALVAAMGTLVGPSVGSRHKRREREAMLLQKLSRDFYTDGPEVFEGIKHKSISPFLLKTFERLATRMPGPDIRDLLEAERDRKQIRSVQALQVVSKIGRAHV